MTPKMMKWLVGGLVIAGALTALIYMGLEGNVVYFYTPKEAVAKADTIHDREIRVGGMVKAGSVTNNQDTLDLDFMITDMKGAEISVKYSGAPPDMFKEGQGVVVEGRIDQAGQSMQARNLFVKHSEEYKKPDDHGSMDAEYLQKSMFKNESKTMQ